MTIESPCRGLVLVVRLQSGGSGASKSPPLQPATKRHGEPSERIKQHSPHIDLYAARKTPSIPNTSIVPYRATEVDRYKTLPTPLVADPSRSGESAAPGCTSTEKLAEYMWKSS
ncbi:hypothetical protein N7513_009259 [Penicillium frequentans]|nr:hypothetical protein N7513_009259 [Penicillium glabrum]